MAEVQPASWLQNAGAVHTAAQMRASVGSLIGPPRVSGSMTTRGGVAPGLGGLLAVTQVGAGAMAVDVASGIVHVPGTAVGPQGTYVCINDATVQLAIAAADGTNPRIDAVIATVRDSFYAGVNDDWLLQVITGTAAPVPLVPTLPDNSFLIAEVLVGAGVTVILQADITDRRAFVGTGLISVADAGERDAIASPYESLAVWNRELGEIQVFNGSEWRRVRGTEQVFYDTVGADTFVKANFPGMVGVTVECQAGGGGGMGAEATGAGEGAVGGGGGGGAYAKSFIPVASLPTSATVTIGDGGVGGGSGISDQGGTGGNSSFDALVVAAGGSGAFLSSGAGATLTMRAAGGGGGTDFGSTGDLIIAGTNGGYGIRGGSGPASIAGDGGSSHLGAGGMGGGFFTSSLPGELYGGGGGGGAASTGSFGAVNGAPGARGRVIVTVHYL